MIIACGLKSPAIQVYVTHSVSPASDGRLINEIKPFCAYIERCHGTDNVWNIAMQQLNPECQSYIRSCAYSDRDCCSYLCKRRVLIEKLCLPVYWNHIRTDRYNHWPMTALLTSSKPCIRHCCDVRRSRICSFASARRFVIKSEADGER